jgi:hypothetical protein
VVKHIIEGFIAFGTIAVAVLAIWGDWFRFNLAPAKVTLDLHTPDGDPALFSTGTRAMFYHLKVINQRGWFRPNSTRSSGSGCISETIASRTAFSRPLARSSTAAATPGIGCSAKPVAFDPCVSIPGSKRSAINQVGISSRIRSAISGSRLTTPQIFQSNSNFSWTVATPSCIGRPLYIPPPC